MLDLVGEPGTMGPVTGERRQLHTSEWLEHFARAGYPDATPLAAGAEGSVYRLGNDTVAKVWQRRRVSELARLQRFYADVAAHPLPFATPEIARVMQVGDVAVTFERELPGTPLQDRLAVSDSELDPAAVAAVVGVLRALAEVPASPAMVDMPVLDETLPLWAGADSFLGALGALLGRRVARFGGLLRARVPDFDTRYAQLLVALAAVEPVPASVVHGDLFGENILVDDASRPVAVLDFGFLTTAGDPRLDAAITAAVMNMYGPHAHVITDALTRKFAVELGCPTQTLLVYQGVYAVATANAFTADGTDGHFGWCVAQLSRPDLLEALCP